MIQTVKAKSKWMGGKLHNYEIYYLYSIPNIAAWLIQDVK
jgi:hypothetical protein